MYLCVPFTHLCQLITLSTVSTIDTSPALSFGEYKVGVVASLLCYLGVADDRFDFLSERLKSFGYVKATDVNKLFYSCESLEQLERAKDILAWLGEKLKVIVNFPQAPSPILGHIRNS